MSASHFHVLSTRVFFATFIHETQKFGTKISKVSFVLKYPNIIFLFHDLNIEPNARTIIRLRLSMCRKKTNSSEFGSKDNKFLQSWCKSNEILFSLYSSSNVKCPQTQTEWNLCDKTLEVIRIWVGKNPFNSSPFASAELVNVTKSKMYEENYKTH